jgi:hypothetical protein
MSRFSLTEAAFSGFNFIGRQWPTVMVWAGMRIAVAIVMMAIVAAVAADDLAHLAALTLRGPEQLADPTELYELILRVGPIPASIWFVGLILEAILIAAFYRAYLRPEEARFAYVRLGKAELAVIGAMLLWWLLYFVGLFAVSFIVIFAEVLPPVIAAIVAVAAFIAYVVLLIWAIVRSSLILVDSFARRKVSLRHSFELTRGHFWPLIGAYLIGLAVTVVLSVAALALFMLIAAVAALAAGQDLASVGRVFNPDSGVLALTFSAALVVYILYNAITGACSYPLIFGPTAEAYLAFKEQGYDRPAPSDGPDAGVRVEASPGPAEAGA